VCTTITEFSRISFTSQQTLIAFQTLKTLPMSSGSHWCTPQISCNTAMKQYSAPFLRFILIALFVKRSLSTILTVASRAFTTKVPINHELQGSSNKDFVCLYNWHLTCAVNETSTSITLQHVDLFSINSLFLGCLDTANATARRPTFVVVNSNSHSHFTIWMSGWLPDLTSFFTCCR
jgi:hypothetical protein